MTRFPTALTTPELALEQRIEARETNRVHLLKNGAQAHELTREDRAKGGRARAEKLRKRKELREQFQLEQLEDLARQDRGYGVTSALALVVEAVEVLALPFRL
jgi:hypothetical protein